MASFRQPRLILCWHAKIWFLPCTSQWLILLENPWLHFFFSFNSHSNSSHKNLKPCFDWIFPRSTLPHRGSSCKNNKKITKPIFQSCLGKFYFGFASANVQTPLRAAFIPRHVHPDFSFMPFCLEMSCWRILFCACQRTSMFFMTFMNVTSLGTCCLSGRVAAKLEVIVTRISNFGGGWSISWGQ